MKIHHWLVTLVLLCAVFAVLPDGYLVWSADPFLVDREPLDKEPSVQDPTAEEAISALTDTGLLWPMGLGRNDDSAQLNAVDAPFARREFLQILDFSLSDPGLKTDSPSGGSRAVPVATARSEP